MENSEQTRLNRKKTKTGGSSANMLLILIVVAALGFVLGITQFIAAQSTRSDFRALEERLEEIEQENERLKERYDEINEENKKLREENKMLRSSEVIDRGSREVDRVAITINNGANEALIDRALDILMEHSVRATFFPMGSWVEQNPEVWRRAVAEGHELGNSTYSHRPFSLLSEDQVREELSGWQKAVEEALGQPYRTLFFRPPYGDGFFPGQRHRGGPFQEIVAEKGMFPVLWDIELVYALRGVPYTADRITGHIRESAMGGSIILLHLRSEDIEALPGIIAGLRERDLEPCSLSEMLLAGSKVED